MDHLPHSVESPAERLDRKDSEAAGTRRMNSEVQIELAQFRRWCGEI